MRRLLVIVASAPLFAAACLGPDVPEPPGPEAGRDHLTPAELAQLLGEGTIRPVTDVEEVDRDPFEPYSPRGAMDDDPFAAYPPDMDADPAPNSGWRAADGEAGANAAAPPRDGAASEAPGAADPLAALEALAGTGSGVDGVEGAGEPTEPQPTEPKRIAPPVNPLELFEENPYLVFGRRIKVYPDGTITKPYPLRPGTGDKMKQLIEDYGNFPTWTAEMGSGPSPPNLVKLDLLPEWDIELVQDMRNPADKRGESVPVADWLVVTTGEDLLWEVEEFINLFAAGVPQIEIEAKIVEITFTESLDIGIRPQSGIPIFDWPDNTFVQSFDYLLSNQADGIEGLLSVGGVQDGFAFNAVLEAIATNDNVSIISRPKVAVREGGRAQILSTQRIPFLEVTSVNNTGGINTKLSYQEIGVQLFVVPRVVGTDTVALDIDIEASQQSGSQTVITSGPDQVSIPVLGTRSARTVVYLRPGQAVILGGLINERSVDRVRKIPLLGDIPLVKYLFRSKLTVKEQSNVLFFIRPRILQGADMSRDF